MKKFLFAAIASLCLIASAFSAPKPPVLEPIEFDVIQEQGEINTYIIDPRVEVVAMICRLAELPGFTNTYKNRADPVIPQMMTLLEKYKNHKAVKTVKNLQKKGFDAGAMISLAYHIKPDFSGTIIEFEPFPENLAPQWKKIGTKATYDFVKQIHSFAVDTNFKRLYVLNKTSYLQDVNYQKKFAEDSGIAKWAEDFFKNDEVESPVLTYSRFTVGYIFYDYIKGSDGKTTCCATLYPGCPPMDFEKCYIGFYAQLYAQKYWDDVKESFINYYKDYQRKFHPERTEEFINKLEINYLYLTVLLADYCWLAYIKEIAPEDHPSYEELIGMMEKEVGDKNVVEAIELIEEYTSNRDKYPTFDDFSTRINDFIKTLQIKE